MTDVRAHRRTAGPRRQRAGLRPCRARRTRIAACASTSLHLWAHIAIPTPPEWIVIRVLVVRHQPTLCSGDGDAPAPKGQVQCRSLACVQARLPAARGPRTFTELGLQESDAGRTRRREDSASTPGVMHDVHTVCITHDGWCWAQVPGQISGAAPCIAHSLSTSLLNDR